MSEIFKQVEQAILERKRSLAEAIITAADIKTRHQNESERKEKEYRLSVEQRIERNKKFLEDSGAVGLFKDLINSGIVRMSDNPTYAEGIKYGEPRLDIRNLVGYEIVKTGVYEPAKIEWEQQCESVSLVFNHQTQQYRSLKDGLCEANVYDYCTFIVSPSGQIGIDKNGKFDYDERSFTEIKVEEIPQVVSKVLMQHIK